MIKPAFCFFRMGVVNSLTAIMCALPEEFDAIKTVFQ